MWPRTRRSSRATLGVALLPAWVAVGRVGATARALQSTRDDDPGTDAGWAVTTAFRLLDQIGIRPTDSMACIVSNRFAAYTSIPWTDRMLSAGQPQSVAREHLSLIDAALAASGEIRVEDAPYGEPRIACAMDGELLRALREGCATLGVRLRSCMPLLSACTIAASERSRAGALFVGCMEQEGLAYALAANGRCRSVGSEWLPNASRSSAHAALRRLRLRQIDWPDGVEELFFDAATGDFVNDSTPVALATGPHDHGTSDRADAWVRFATGSAR